MQRVRLPPYAVDRLAAASDLRVSSAMAKIKCPNCDRSVRLSDEQFGRTLRCSKCGGRFVAEREASAVDDDDAQSSPIQKETEIAAASSKLRAAAGPIELRCTRCGSDQVQNF